MKGPRRGSQQNMKRTAISFFVAISTPAIVLPAAISQPLFAQDAPAATEATGSAEPDSSQVTSSREADNEMVLLQFREQDWQTALSWLAEKLELNLDWQILPEDKLSLSSSQPISLEAAEDLFNMQLLSRGFVLLKRDGVLRLASLKDLDITLVPRVEPEALAQLSKHSIARVSFPLEWMIAEEAAKELQPLLSPYGKLSPMASANRLEVVDAVVNLQEFHRLLIATEKADARRERVAEFRMKHRRVEDIAPKVRQLLGLPADNTATPNQTQLDIEEAKFKVEAIKQMGRDARDLVSQEKKPTIFVAVNDKENSLLVNAPPNKIEIVRQAVEAMDKPIENKETAWETISRVKVHDVSGFDPIMITRMVVGLQEKGSIDKMTRVQYEPAYNRFIVFGSPEDQLTISQLMESFKAEKRSASVLPLASLDPVYASKAVLTILKTPDRPSSTPGTATDGRFQVEADTKNHRLLLWATPTEITEVREFLARLGETFSSQIMDSKLHVIEMKGQDTEEVTQKLQLIWAEISDSPLLLDPGQSTSESVVAPQSSETAPENHVVNASALETRFVTTSSEGNPGGQPKPEGDEPARITEQQESAPVRLMKNGNGDLVVLSKDPVAAETAKRLIAQLLTDKSQFRAIELKHAQAFVVRQQLDVLLANTLATENSRLSTNARMFIDVDTRTNRIIVQNADERQWKIIRESVEILDQESSGQENFKRSRVTFRFQHRKATEVAEALKQAYSDLLKVGDRTTNPMAMRAAAFNQNLAAANSSPEYQGLISFSVDEKANLLIVSAPKYLMEEVLKLVESMDTPQDGNAIAILSTADLPFTENGNAARAAANLRRLFQGR